MPRVVSFCAEKIDYINYKDAPLAGGHFDEQSASASTSRSAKSNPFWQNPQAFGCLPGQATYKMWWAALLCPHIMTLVRSIKRFFDAADYIAYRLFLLLGAVLLIWQTLRP